MRWATLRLIEDVILSRRGENEFLPSLPGETHGRPRCAEGWVSQEPILRAQTNHRSFHPHDCIDCDNALALPAHDQRIYLRFQHRRLGG